MNHGRAAAAACLNVWSKYALHNPAVQLYELAVCGSSGQSFQANGTCSSKEVQPPCALQEGRIASFKGLEHVEEGLSHLAQEILHLLTAPSYHAPNPTKSHPRHRCHCQRSSAAALEVHLWHRYLFTHRHRYHS